MKKALILSNMIWLSFMILMAFGPSQEPVKNNNCLSSVYKHDPNNKFEGVPLGLAKEMITNYKKNNPKKPLSAWLSLEDLKKFVAELEAVNCKECGGTKELGARFYFIEYPEVDKMKANKYFANVSLKYAGLNNLMIVPTMKQGELQQDFNMRATNFDCNKLPTFDKMYRPAGARTSGDGEVGIMNKMNMGPPYGGGNLGDN
jgi:hypothetical protein